MTVKELIERLQTLDPEYKVFVSSDEEGNSFSPVQCVQEEFFVDWGNRYENECLAAEDAEEDTPKAVVLWP